MLGLHRIAGGPETHRDRFAGLVLTNARRAAPIWTEAARLIVM